MTSKPIRWKWALGILVLAAVGLVLVWRRDISQQDRVLKTIIVLAVSGILLFIWALFFSRFRWKSRLIVLLGGIAVAAFCVSSLEVAGVTGDLIPIVRWKGRRPKVAQIPMIPASTNKNSITAEFPQFLGPDRNGIIKGVALETNWTAHPPELLWRHEVGSAWSGFAISGSLAITQEQQDQQELVTAYDLLTGVPVWAHSDECRYFTTLGGEGPRSNPTVVGGRVFTLGATGILNCLDRATGKVIWTRNLAREHAASKLDWGYPGAPLVHNGLVIVNVGGQPNKSLLSHDAESGNFVWGGGDDAASYSSPTLLTLGGIEQIVMFTHKQVSGFDPTNGTNLWNYPWPASHPHITMPIAISTNRLLVSSGYGYGSELLEISRSSRTMTANRVWKSNRLKSKFANLIFYKGYVYGLDDGIMTCFDPEAGERKWQGDRHGHGQMLLVGDILLLMAENGEILLIEPIPTEEHVVARFKVFKDKTWNPPALAGPYLLVRNNLEAACFRLPLMKQK